MFRLLDLVNRLRYPILHDKPQLTKGELKMVEIKILATLKKVFCNEAFLASFCSRLSLFKARPIE